jgi:hypothetical protein
MTKAALYAPPSALLRAALSLLLLLVFYAVLLSIAAALFVAPVAALLTIGLSFYVAFMFALCWIPAGLLVMSAFTTRRPQFVAPSRQLKRDEAPALFAMVEELASQAGTEAYQCDRSVDVAGDRRRRRPGCIRWMGTAARRVNGVAKRAHVQSCSRAISSPIV